MIQLEEYTADVKENIDELKAKFCNELPPRELKDETFFHRFLIARNFDMEKTESMLRKHISDVKLYGAHFETYEPIEHIATYISVSFIGYDKAGFPVIYIDFGKMDSKGIVKTFTFDQVAKYIVYLMETYIDRMTEQTKILRKPITKLVVICNFDQLNILKAASKPVIQYFVDGLILFQDNYPERIKEIIIINGAYYFHVAFNLVKNFFSRELMEKIRILGPSDWKDYLLDKMDSKQVPAFLGGKKTDPDGNELCNSFVIHGKKIPEQYYVMNQKTSIREENDVEKMLVKQLSCAEITLEVQEPGTNIEWHFQTKSKDIAFGLYYKSNVTETNTELKEIIPKERVDTTQFFEAGLHKCNKVGIYKIVFDNSYSWIYSKTIYYRIRLIKPENQK